jgi:hypothetical protein
MARRDVSSRTRVDSLNNSMLAEDFSPFVAVLLISVAAREARGLKHESVIFKHVPVRGDSGLPS